MRRALVANDSPTTKAAAAARGRGTRIEAVFATCRAADRAALVLYLTGAYPDRATGRMLIETLSEAGCDLLELGVPFSDPVADGPTIQRASAEALAAGATLDVVLDLAAATRAVRPATVLFSSVNPLFHRGYGEAVRRVAEAGVDGILAPDLPIEEDPELGEAARAAGLDLVYLAAPTTPPERKQLIAARTSGFLYYISLRGVTGARARVADDIVEQLAPIRAASSIPVAVGFGVSTPDQAHAVARHADGVVVGSALIDLIARHASSGMAVLRAEVTAFVRDLAAAMTR